MSEGKAVFDERDAWSEHQPSAQQENEFIRLHGFEEYSKWYLGIDDEHDEHTKGRYKFLWRFRSCSPLWSATAESSAGQYKYIDIENAAAHLHGMIDQLHHQPVATRR